LTDNQEALLAPQQQQQQQPQTPQQQQQLQQNPETTVATVTGALNEENVPNAWCLRLWRITLQTNPQLIPQLIPLAFLPTARNDRVQLTSGNSASDFPASVAARDSCQATQ
jgi:hypothetical protein